MELLKKQHEYSVSASLAILLGVFLAILFGYTLVFAGVSESARGFAWSSGVTSNPQGYEGMGWISSNNLSDPTGGQTVSYGINIPTSDGDLSGYAWNDLYGWISFRDVDLVGGAEGGCGPLTQAKRVGNTLTGGARIIAIRDAGSNSGGYNGCISLSGVATNGSNYGVTIAGNALNGYAWSGDLGWISMSGNGYGITITAGPDLTIDSLTPSAGPYTQGTGITINGTVRNSGDASTGVGFSDQLSYQWGGTTGAWVSIPTAPANHPALINGNTVSDSGSYTPNQTGALYFRYCADPVGAVTAESAVSKGNNCQITSGLTVNPFGALPAPDLSIVSFTQGSGPYTQNVAINLTGIVRNSGNAPTLAGFTDNFTYQWGGTSGTWLPNPGPNDAKFSGSNNEVSNGVLNQNNQATDNKTFTPNQTGSLYLQYCVDSRSQIAEGAGESNNCQVSSEIVVGSGGPGIVCTSVTKSNCDLLNGNLNDTVAGSCSLGYSGSCNYTCKDVSGIGDWNKNTNTCVANPTIDRFQICDALGGNCVDSKSVPARTALKIKWSASNADTCGRFAGPGDFSTGAGSPISGTDDITANSLPGKTDIYEIICSKGASSVRDTAQVRTAGPDLNVDRRITDINGIVTLSWTTAGALGCKVSGGGINPIIDVDTFGATTKSIQINAQTTFTLNCGALGTDTVRVDITGWQAGT